MPSREDILVEKTHKGDGLETKERIFYTLTDDKRFIQHRTAKLLALLISLLKEKGLISEEVLDEFLFQVVH